MSADWLLVKGPAGALARLPSDVALQVVGDGKRGYSVVESDAEAEPGRKAGGRRRKSEAGE